MFREMTLGQYYKADSFIHSLDPRVKLFGTLIYVISLFLPKSPLNLIWATIFLAAVIKISTVPWKLLIRGVKPLIFIIVFSALINIFSVKGTVLLKIGPFHVTMEGILVAIYMVIRLIYLVMGSAIMTYTTTPNQLTQGLEKSFHIFKKIKLPVHEIAMMMSIALRFIPILTEELDRILKAQMSRGADFEEGNIFRKIRQFVPVLVPLFIAAIRRASDLAMAMDARCYNGGENRTQLRPLKYDNNDRKAYAVILLYFVIMIALSICRRML